MTLAIAGHPNFPYLVGLVDLNKILMEFIGNSNGSESPTLKDVISKKTLSLKSWCSILINIYKAIQDLHGTGVLYNDLHYRNVFDSNFVKIIDFGKATL